MKTLVLSALIAVATAANPFATVNAEVRVDHVKKNELIDNAERIEAFKSQLAFHQRNVAVLWNQYAQAAAHIRNGRGSHAELERDKVYFISVYQKDIEKNLRVEASKRAIAEIEARYEQAYAERQAYEAKQLATLQAQLRAELKKEAKKFEKAKRKNAALVNAETRPLLQEVERDFAQSSERAESLAVAIDQHTIAAR